jgi:hypothetical protein
MWDWRLVPTVWRIVCTILRSSEARENFESRYMKGGSRSFRDAQRKASPPSGTLSSSGARSRALLSCSLAGDFGSLMTSSRRDKNLAAYPAPELAPLHFQVINDWRRETERERVTER